MSANATAPLPLPDLTLPKSNTATVRAVLNGYMREAVRVFTSLPVTWLPPATRTLYARTLSLTQRQLKEDPRKVVLALRQPSHGALLWTLLRECTPEGDHAALARQLNELCLLLLTELALSGVASPEPFPRPGERWPLLRSISGAFLLELEASVESVSFVRQGIVLRKGTQTWNLSLGEGLSEQLPAGTPARRTRPYHRIVDNIVLAETDNNPLSMFEAHPDKSGNAISLDGHPAEEWVETLRQSFALVDKYLPLIGEEMRLVLRTIIPVGYHAEKHLSASYQEAIGTIYMTLHPNLMTMTEALIHEFQHNKLNAAMHLGPMLHNAFSPLYSSPVRPDPRPLHGVVLAVHAFQPIAKLYEAMAADHHPFAANPSWHKRFRDIIRMDRAGAETVLMNGQITPFGEGLFQEMSALDTELRLYEEAHWTEAPAVEPPPLPE